MEFQARPFALVTAASSPLGYELAACCARRGYDLLVASGTNDVQQAARQLRELGTNVYGVRVDLSRAEGVRALLAAALGRTPDALLIDVSEALGDAASEEELYEPRPAVDPSLVALLSLAHNLALDMRARGGGRVLLAGGSARAGGVHRAAYEASRGFLDSFAFALRRELKPAGVHVAAVIPASRDGEGPATAGDREALARTAFDLLMRNAEESPSERDSGVRAWSARPANVEGLGGVRSKMAASR